MTLTESMVSSLILVSLATQTGNLFGVSMTALGKSRLRDNVNAAIQRDLEDVRQIVSTWKADASMATNGQLAYSPDATHCQGGTLATALLAEKANELAASKTLDLSSSSTNLQGLTLTRTIGTATNNTNLIQVYYSTSTNSPLKTEFSATLGIPAQSWCAT